MSASDFHADPAVAAGPRKRSRLLFVPLAIFLALAALFFVRLFAGDVARLPSALIGKQVPTFTLPAVAGLNTTPGLSDADLRRGHVTVVNVFASWCVPCGQEHPVLMQLAGRNVHVAGIAYKDEPENIRRFLGSDGNPFSLVGADRSGRSAIDWGVYGVPETFVVKGDGTIAYKFIGPLTPEALDQTLMPEIAKAEQASSP